MSFSLEQYADCFKSISQKEYSSDAKLLNQLVIENPGQKRADFDGLVTLYRATNGDIKKVEELAARSISESNTDGLGI